MKELKIGQSVEDFGLGSKDAGHLACVVCRSDDTIHGGTYVRFVYGDTVRQCGASEAHGMVDPFGPSGHGKFLVIINPKFISGLTHQYDIDVDMDDDSDYDCGCGDGIVGDGEYYGCSC